MSINSFPLNVESSFHKLIRAHLATIQTEINAALGTAHTLAYYAQKQPETFPSVRGWVYLAGMADSRRSKLAALVQLDVFVKSASASTPDRRLALLIRDGLMQKLDLTTSRNAFYSYFPVKDYLASPTAPPTIGECRIEPEGPWQDLPSGDPLITRFQADFKLFHK